SASGPMLRMKFTRSQISSSFSLCPRGPNGGMLSPAPFLMLENSAASPEPFFQLSGRVRSAATAMALPCARPSSPWQSGQFWRKDVLPRSIEAFAYGIGLLTGAADCAPEPVVATTTKSPAASAIGAAPNAFVNTDSPISSPAAILSPRRSGGNGEYGGNGQQRRHGETENARLDHRTHTGRNVEVEVHRMAQLCTIARHLKVGSEPGSE